eukprot:scaffold11.g3954.t1
MFVLATGVFASTWLGNSFVSLGELIIKKVPLVKHVYSAAKQVSAAVNPESEAAKGFRRDQGFSRGQRGRKRGRGGGLRGAGRRRRSAGRPDGGGPGGRGPRRRCRGAPGRLLALRRCGGAWRALGRFLSPQPSHARHPPSACRRECVIIRHPRHGEYAFGFITGSTTLQTMDGDERLEVVFVPTNHVYVGDLFLLGSRDIIRSSLSVREGIEIVVSLGLVVPNKIATIPGTPLSPGA